MLDEPPNLKSMASTKGHRDVAPDSEPRLLPHLVDTAAKQTPDRMVGMIPKSPDISKGFLKLTMRDLANAVDYMAYWIEERAGKIVNEPIAYLGVNDFRYWIIELAGLKCAHPVLLPSARNPDSHNMALFSSVKCKTLFFSPPFEFKAAGLRQADISTFVVPTFEEMISPREILSYPYQKSWEEAKLDPIAICHTSGSTGAPKPITLNNMWSRCIDAGRILPGVDGRRDANISILDGTTWYLGFPGFHAMGVAFGICSLFLNESIVVLSSPETPANGKMIVDMMRQLDFGHLIGAPMLFDDIVKNYRQEFIDYAGFLKAVHNAGGPLANTTGEFLASRFDVIQLYGQTEAGKINTLVSERQYWQWFEFNFNYGGARMEKVDGDDEIYELIIDRVPGQEWCQAVFATQPHLDTWRTRDFFRKHPTKTLYQFEGRRDDVIVMNNGEKFNPVGMEGTIQSHPLVTGVLVAGHSRDQLCVVLEGGKEAVDIDKVWPTIEQANKEAPGHARIYKHMVCIASPEKPFPRAGKGTVQRGAATRLYEKEIEELYKSKRGPRRAPEKDMPRLKLPRETVKEFVRQSVAYQLLDGGKFEDTEDFFVLGFDSLQTTQLARSLADAFGPHMPASSHRAITARLIYENSSVAKTTDAIFALLNGEQAEDIDQTAFKEIQQLISRYTSDLPLKPVKTSQPLNANAGLHVAITGTTGFLGFYLLQVLQGDDRVRHITCINRSEAAASKYNSAAGESHTSKSKLSFLRASFGAPNLGLLPATYNDLLSTVDIVIHNAWAVDFNRALSSFEYPHLVATRTLLDWSLTSPKNVHLVFISTMATVAYWPGYYSNTAKHRPSPAAAGKVSETPPNLDRIPSGHMGYAQSKYVAESILNHAALQHQVPITILRPGQITDPITQAASGPRSSSLDWLPLMLRSSKALGLLPETLTCNGLIDFIPVDVLATVIGEIVLDGTRDGVGVKTGEPAVFNLVNPTPVAYGELLSDIQAHLDANGTKTKASTIVEWVEELKKKMKSQDQEEEVGVLEKYPALKLLAFFEGLAGSFARGAEDSGVETANGCKVSRAMREMAPVTGADVTAWMQRWGI